MKNQPLAWTWFVLLSGFALAAETAPAPQVQNGSFEHDAYGASPGYARQNGGQITGWQTAGSVGVNPVWKDPRQRTGPESPFHDNGSVPDGRQLAFLQGPGALRQTLSGFQAGRRYRVLLRENARRQRRGDAWPQMRVSLGGQILVSAHDVTPVAGAEQLQTPFYRLESAWFVAPGVGPYELAIEAVQSLQTTTLLIDDVRLEQAADP